MLDHPKLSAQFWNAGKITQKFKQCHFLFKLNRKGLWGFLQKKTQGTKFQEVEILEPCIFLDLTKLV